MARTSTRRTGLRSLVSRNQLIGSAMTTGALASQVRSSAGPAILASVVDDGPGASPAQQAITTALLMLAGVVPRLPAPSGALRADRGASSPPVPLCVSDAGRGPVLGLPHGSPAIAAALRFAAERYPACLAGSAPRRSAGRANQPGATPVTAETNAAPAASVARSAARTGGLCPNGRLIRLFASSRRVPAAMFAVAAIAVGLRIALIAHWDTYGALQLPLVFETAAATVISATAASPLGEPERVTGRWLPYLRLGFALALTAAAAGALAAAGVGAHLAGGTLDVLRNLVGITGIGLLCAATLTSGLAWTGPVAYLIPGAYALYTQWHHPALTTPWLWPARPSPDLGAALCAGLVFAVAITWITVRGARDVAAE